MAINLCYTIFTMLEYIQPEYIKEETLKDGSHELNEVTILQLIPEMQDIVTRLRSTDIEKLESEQAQALYDDLVHLAGWTDAAFNYDNDHGTNWRSKIDISKDEIEDLGREISKRL